jgi:hypothetical protein
MRTKLSQAGKGGFGVATKRGEQRIKTTELMTAFDRRQSALRPISSPWRWSIAVHVSARDDAQIAMSNCQRPTAIAAIGSARAREYVPRIRAPQYQVEVPTKISSG